MNSENGRNLVLHMVIVFVLIGDCIGVWPPSQTKALKLKVEGTNEKTQPIHFDAPHTTLFKLSNKVRI